MKNHTSKNENEFLNKLGISILSNVIIKLFLKIIEHF